MGQACGLAAPPSLHARAPPSRQAWQLPHHCITQGNGGQDREILNRINAGSQVFRLKNHKLVFTSNTWIQNRTFTAACELTGRSYALQEWQALN